MPTTPENFIPIPLLVYEMEDRQTIGRTNGQMHGHMDRQRDRQTDTQTNFGWGRFSLRSQFEIIIIIVTTIYLSMYVPDSQDKIRTHRDRDDTIPRKYLFHNFRYIYVLCIYLMSWKTTYFISVTHLWAVLMPQVVWSSSRARHVALLNPQISRQNDGIVLFSKESFSAGLS